MTVVNNSAPRTHPNDKLRYIPKSGMSRDHTRTGSRRSRCLGGVAEVRPCETGWGDEWSFSCKVLYLHKFFLPITTPKSNPSKHYKHFRKAVAFAFRKLELCRHCRFRAGSFSGLSSRIQVLAHMPC